jgi:hypothetical protein
MAQLSKLTGHGKQAMFSSNCVPSSCADPARRPSAELADSESMLKLLQVELVVLTMPKGSFCD